MRAVLCTFLLLAAFAAGAETTLRVMGFGGASNWPLFVASDRGFFERQGLRVELARASDSASQMKQLADGRIDIAMTAMDNVVAWDDGEVFAFMGVNHGGRFQLFAQRDFRAIPALAGRDIGVDAVSTGYAFVLEQMLHDGGLRRAGYRLVSLGGSRERWDALRTGKVAATILNAPYDALARNEGYTLLARSEKIGRYQGSVGAARRGWAREHKAELVGYVTAYVLAVRWLYEPANREQALAVLMRTQRNIAREDAERTYDELLNPATGSLARDGALDVEGVSRVLELRREFAVARKPVADAAMYYDLRYWREALSNLDARR